MKSTNSTFLIGLFMTMALSLSAQTDVYVSDNSSTFIYVDGDGFTDQSTDVDHAPLFITNGINLAGTNSFIYLRNGAQLLQSANVQNQGLGQLSIYQTGDANQWTYNFWGSPVGNTTANNSANRNFIANNNFYDVTGLLTSNLATFTSGYDGSSSPLVISNRWLYTFSPGQNYSDWDYVGETGTVTPGYGFTMKGVSGTTNQLYDFRGKPNTGTIAVDVLGPVGGEPQFTLAGNPYPSAIDMVDFFHDATANNGSVFNQILFWDDDFSGSHYVEDYIGGYGIYTISASGVVSYVAAPRNTYDTGGNITGGTGSSPNNTPGVNAPGRYLPVGQGFMIEGTADGTVEFRNSFRSYWKTSSGDSVFFEAEETDTRTTSNDSEEQTTYQGNEIPEEWMRIRILVDIEHTNGLFTRELLVNFTDEATDAIDFGLEAAHSDLKPSDGHFVVDDEAIAILAVPFTTDRKIPLTVLTAQQQVLGIRTYGLQNFPEEIPIYLHDKYENTYTDMKIQGFSVPIEAGTFSDRFEIVFESEDTLSEEVIITEDFSIFQNNNTSQLTILNPNSVSVSHFSLFDVAGKRVIDLPLDLQSKYYFSTKNLSDGVYIAQVSVEDATAITKKVIIKN
ncbi:MAG: T9SS type A sorting domain-containing protein [bacterium]